MFDRENLRAIFDQTRIIRKPTYGIISGYHELPYICLGASTEDSYKTMRVRGKVQVSPRFIIRPQHCEPSYGDIFGEENIDSTLVGRVFGFLGFRGKPVECKSDSLEVSQLGSAVDDVLSDTLDELERFEDITTGVIITPNSRYYPVSLERFISSIVEEEFNV